MSFLPPGENIIETKKCRISGKDFFVTDKDLEFYDKISPVFAGQKYLIPSPTLCPDERQKRRLSFRNERKLYHRKCDLTGKQIISIYSSDKPYQVYDQKVWWSDDWSPLEYGVSFDFEKGFFEQLDKLMKTTPCASRLTTEMTMENSDFCNCCGNLKNCYLLVESMFSQDCYYGKGVNKSDTCIDCFKVHSCTGCYESVNSSNCYSSHYILDCQNCQNCYFSRNLIGCENCFGCINLTEKKFYINNIPHSPKEYKQKIEQIVTSQTKSEIHRKFIDFQKKQLFRSYEGISNENAVGNYLNECKSVFECFDCRGLEKSKFCWDMKKITVPSNNNYDITYYGEGVNNCLEAHVVGNICNEILFCDTVNSNAQNCVYSIGCQKSHDIFGCVNFKTGSHCILNKSYSIHEYETLCGKIIDHMRSTGEWGEFFPHTLSPFGYDETVAQEYFPMTESEVRAKGWNWKGDEETSSYHGPYYIPLSISQYDERVMGFNTATKNINECLNGIIQCDITHKPFKIIKQELAFYIENSIPIPTKHPDQRHKERMDLRNPRILHERTCTECQKEIVTTYSPERTERIVCEECYRKLVY